jgi:hypothetical protein
MKQTAVEWLEKFLKERYTLMDSEAIFQHAKQMEKEQIINAYADGINHDFTDLDIEFGIGSSDREYHAEKYYKETYGDK